MRDIDHQDRGGLLGPLKNLSFFARQPITEPLGPRPASANYRGFHLNDWDLCIGCSTCQKVCDNAAITMVKVPGLAEDPAKGIRNLRPAIDYGRCCWCALCVDLCPTGSIALSREYVHTCLDSELDSYFILPDARGIHGTPYPKGWAKSTDADLVALERQPMTEQAAAVRIENFAEIVAGYDANQALIEASRCVQCGMCHDACPTHMHAPEYIRAIWKGDLEGAVREIYRTNPFAHTCGRVCTHRCETACSVGHRGAPIAIRWLKRYAMDAVDHARVKQIAAEGRADFISGKRVAIVGAGPAGLTAAFDLVRQGHDVTVLEAQAQGGGMVRYGIPDYRMPADRLDRDLDIITSLGVKIRYNTRVGVDLTMERLQAEYDAVVLGVGLWMGRSTRVPGADQAGVKRAVDLLRAVAAGEPIEVPQSAVIIGGGNVAMDITRTLARLQQQRYGEVRITLTALEDLDHFLADADEIREAREEGVQILDARGPQEILTREGQVAGLRTWGVRSIFDPAGRFAPSYDPADEQIHPGDLVVEAIGQAADVNLLGEALTEALQWHRGRLQVDSQGRTNLEWLWAAGDMVRGPDVVSAVADGHRVADSIHAYLSVQEHAP
ncbi:FAD-dependent oxidoreductase [uncultured Lamprocystis sp.]|jgi:glutamate synthase (NADPH/NADH) small chain|uniref:FAD-dependent oxidoreductase n=2 Tax=uncultured Lamprocystis sp. TaxID=543132 RepID=UPI0025D78AE4|nr:FAD-dependent oxidoreductase [uncultured Lamprocystis sp.]